MKKILGFLICTSLLISCHRKIVPQTTNATINNGNVFANDNENSKIDTVTSIKGTDTVKTVTNLNAIKYIVVSDGFGKVIDPGDSTIKFNKLQLSKGFTTQQKLNLKTRYNTIPPRVLYVNQQLQQQSARGTFYVLQKKFWYWKKGDGLFYLDDKYYL